MSHTLDHPTDGSLAACGPKKGSDPLNAGGLTPFSDADEVKSLGFAEARSLKRELLDELRASREDGMAVRPEDLLPRWPTDPKADPDLAGRPVVLKVSGIDGNEPETLAQFQHTHIVPIYSRHEDERAGLRAVCMPYFGGASLSRVLQALWAEARLPSRGEQLVIALSEVRGPVCNLVPLNQQPAMTNGPLAALVGMKYTQAVAWIVLRRAGAVQHAHERCARHRGLKPTHG